MARKQKQPVEPPVPEAINRLLAEPVSIEELLSVGEHRDTGIMTRMSRRELQELVPETDGLGMEHDRVLALARFPVERALLVRNGATPERLSQFDTKAAEHYRRIFANHAAAQAVKTTKSEAQRAQRRATTMNDAPATETTGKKAGKATKGAAKKAAKAPAKEAKKGVGRKADTSVYETMVVATSAEARDGSFFDAVMKAASKPIKLETLIAKVAKDQTEGLRSAKDADAVIRTRVRDGFTRLGYLKAAKA